MADFLLLYYSIGAALTMISVVARGPWLQKHTVTVLQPHGGSVEKETRDVAEFVAMILMGIFLWPGYFIFHWVYAPIHDALAERSYMNTMVNDPELWVPPDLQDEVDRRRSLKIR